MGWGKLQPRSVCNFLRRAVPSLLRALLAFCPSGRLKGCLLKYPLAALSGLVKSGGER